jgi:hypothetical protein
MRKSLIYFLSRGKFKILATPSLTRNEGKAIFQVIRVLFKMTNY